MLGSIPGCTILIMLQFRERCVFGVHGRGRLHMRRAIWSVPVAIVAEALLLLPLPAALADSAVLHVDNGGPNCTDSGSGRPSQRSAPSAQLPLRRPPGGPYRWRPAAPPRRSR